VIELSGLPANSFDVPRDRGLFRHERIAVIRQRMRTHKPELVVMYGVKDKKHWEEIAGGGFPPDRLLQTSVYDFCIHATSRQAQPKGRVLGGVGGETAPSSQSLVAASQHVAARTNFADGYFMRCLSRQRPLKHEVAADRAHQLETLVKVTESHFDIVNG
jgi:hypothetical protein